MDFGLFKVLLTLRDVGTFARGPRRPELSGLPPGPFVQHGNPLVAMWEYTKVRRRLDMEQPVAGSRDRLWPWYTWCMALGALGFPVALYAFSLPWALGCLTAVVFGLVAAVLTALIEQSRD